MKTYFFINSFILQLCSCVKLRVQRIAWSSGADSERRERRGDLTEAAGREEPVHRPVWTRIFCLCSFQGCGNVRVVRRGLSRVSVESSDPGMSGSYCRSLYPFSGDQHQQGLDFEAGEIIKVVQVLPGGWWEGEKDGVRGWFPSSYVQVLEVRSSVELSETVTFPFLAFPYVALDFQASVMR